MITVDIQRVVSAGPDDTVIQQCVETVLKAEQKHEAELTIRVVDEVESAQLNEAYRHKNGPTNVLSFQFECPPEVALNLLGDLVICAPVVEREATEQGKTQQAHWLHMIVHGVLHLLGYDHINEQDAQLMEAREVTLLAQMNIANPYQQDRVEEKVS